MKRVLKRAKMNLNRLILLRKVLISATLLAAAHNAAAAVPWPPPDTTVSWQAPAAGAQLAGAQTLRVLTFNDFHGNLDTPASPDGLRPAGGARAAAGVDGGQHVSLEIGQVAGHPAACGRRRRCRCGRRCGCDGRSGGCGDRGGGLGAPTAAAAGEHEQSDQRGGVGEGDPWGGAG